MSSIFFARMSGHIQEDIKRGWSSWNFGAHGFEGTLEELEKAIENIATKYDDYEKALLEAVETRDYEAFYDNEYSENYNTNNSFNELDYDKKQEFIEEIKQKATWLKERDGSGVINVSGFDYEYRQINDALSRNKIRELYPNYWVAIDDRFDGEIAGIELNASNLEEVKKEALGSENEYKYSGEGVGIDVENATLVYSEGDFEGAIHIFELKNN